MTSVDKGKPPFCGGMPDRESVMLNKYEGRKKGNWHLYKHRFFFWLRIAERNQFTTTSVRCDSESIGLRTCAYLLYHAIYYLSILGYIAFNQILFKSLYATDGWFVF